MSIKKEVCIIGGGIAGLFAGLYLQKAGISSIIIEKKKMPGGLVGTFMMENREFTIACNDFGKGFERECQQLGVEIAFHRPKNVFLFTDRSLEIPFSLKTLKALLPYLSEMMKTFFSKRDAGLTLTAFFDKNVQSQPARDLLNLLSYPLGLTEDQIGIDELRREIKDHHGYGYGQPRTPKGGLKALIDALVKRYQQLGGELILGTEGKIQDSKTGVVIAGDQQINAGAIMTCEGKWSSYPTDTPTSLFWGMFLVSLDKAIFPKNTHTLAFFAPGIAQHMQLLNNGILPDEFTFHLFKSGADNDKPPYNFNILFYLPRDQVELSEQELAKIKSFIFSQIAKVIPNFRQAMVFNHYLSPTEFASVHGFSAQTIPLQLSTWQQKPDVFDAKTGLYYLGNSVGPSGDHAGQAILSAQWAVDKLLQQRKK